MDAEACKSRINTICHEFEQEWAQGDDRPVLKDYVSRVSASWQSSLFRELLRIEIKFRESLNDPPRAEDYELAFAEFKFVIDDVFQIASTFDRALQPTDGFDDGATQSYQIREQTADPIDLPPGTQIEQYVVECRLGCGAFGCVYLARDEVLGRLTAIKVPRIDSGTPAGEYIKEARRAASLDHAGIVSVYSAGYVRDEIPFVAMQFVDGPTLKRRLESGSLTLNETIRMICKLADALNHAHKHGFTHRDLKPANILLSNTGEPFIADFGLALHESEQADRKGDTSGTPRYRSPEQVQGEAHWIDGRSDIWSLGVVFYEMLTGRPPFSSTDSAELDRQILDRDPKPPSMINNSIPPEVERVCLKCLRKSKEDRYLSADQLRRDLTKTRISDSRKPVMRITAVAGIVFMAILGLDLIRPFLIGPEHGVQLEVNQDAPIETTLHLQVFVETETDLRGNKSIVSAERRLPLQTGDYIQAKWNVPSGYRGGLLAVDATGKVHDMSDRCLQSNRNPDGSVQYVWPKHDDEDDVKPGLLKLVAPTGTEGLFAFAISEDDSTMPKFPESFPPLSELPPDKLIKLPIETTRGFGNVKESDEIAVEDQCRKIMATLEEICELVEGFVFSHVPPGTRLAPDSNVERVTNVEQRCALLVGCTAYDNFGISLHLRGPKNDVEAVRQTLMSHLGFSVENISVLQESDDSETQRPVRENVIRELDRLAKESQPNDLIFIYFAGHGTQQPDTNGDEPDGLDEVFCPADVSKIETNGSMSIPGGISDDELGAKLQEISDRGANIWLVSDTCHAGSIVRGGDIHEATRMLSPLLVGISKDVIARARQDAVGGDRTRGGPDWVTGAGDWNGRGIVAMYASAADEPTVEKQLPPGDSAKKHHGLFTFALVRAIESADSKTTYSDLLMSIENQYAEWNRSGPHPSIEGGLRSQAIIGFEPTGPIDSPRGR